jgi:F0F1-type ATP synthase membrane subunit b/b'
MGPFMGMATKAFNAVQSRVSQAVNMVKTAAQRGKDIALKVGRKVVDVTRKATTLLKEFTQSAIKKGREAVQKARKWSTQQIKKATEIGRRLVAQARKRVADLVRKGVKLAKEKAVTWIKQKIGGIKQRVLGFLKDRWNRLKEKGIKKPGEAGKEGAKRGGKETTDNAAKKAAELPVAIAQAKAITKANDAVDTPVLALIRVLNASVKSKYSWIKRFEARPEAVPGHYSIYLIASENYVSGYEEKAKRQQLEKFKERMDNFRETIKPSEIKGASPVEGSATSGHARSAHGVSNTVQANILNEPDRIFSGRNTNGREVDIYYKDGSVAITEAGNKRSVITAYGLADTKKKKPTAVSPEKWDNDPSYVEIKLDKGNEVLYSNKERWEANDWP